MGSGVIKVYLISCLMALAVGVPIQEIERARRSIEGLDEHVSVQEVAAVNHEHDSSQWTQQQQIIVPQEHTAWRQESHHQPQHTVAWNVPQHQSVVVEKHLPVKVYKPIFIEKKVHVPHKIYVEKRVPILVERLRGLDDPNNETSSINVTITGLPRNASVAQIINGRGNGNRDPQGPGSGGPRRGNRRDEIDPEDIDLDRRGPRRGNRRDEIDPEIADAIRTLLRVAGQQRDLQQADPPVITIQGNFPPIRNTISLGSGVPIIGSGIGTGFPLFSGGSGIQFISGGQGIDQPFFF